MTVMVWPDFNIGDNVIGNDKAEGSYRGRAAICIADSTITGFGHKHVEVQFDDTGENEKLRTIHLDLIQPAKPAATEDTPVCELGYVDVDSGQPYANGRGPSYG